MKPTATRLTLVAFWGPKTGSLAEVLETCRSGLAETCGNLFAPYLPEQVHATLVGLEAVVEQPGSAPVNRNFLLHHGARRTMDLEGYRRFLSERVGELVVRFGGFRPADTPFQSRGLTPHERGFSIQGGKAVLIGWPVSADGRSFPETLEILRRGAAAFGIAHAYHRGAADRDNDCYLRLGLFRSPVPPPLAEAAQARVRERLAALEPRRARLDLDALAIVAYDDPELPPATSRGWPLRAADLSPGWHERLRPGPGKFITPVGRFPAT